MTSFFLYIKQLAKLTKFFLSLSVSFSAVIGYTLGNNINTNHAFILFLGVFFFATSASIINQLIERKTDSLMARTISRPLILKKIKVKHAILYSFIFALLGAILLSLLSIYSVLLAAFNLLLYTAVYTPLKFKSTFSLIVGGIVGGIPPLIGWFSTGQTKWSVSIILFSVFMFLWQIPHFFVLYIKYNKDYQRAGILSIINNLDPLQKKLIFIIWFLSASVISLMFPFFGITSSGFLSLFLILTNVFILGLFIYFSIRFKKIRYQKTNAFIYGYLLAIFILICIDKFGIA